MNSFVELIINIFSRWLPFLLDNLVYRLIAMVYNLFIGIANTTIFTEDIIDLFASKVYTLLGIFMLFKVSFSIMTYVVNPDEFSDKTKGFGKLVSNIMITLGLLVATPWLFSQAMDVQRIILKDNIIGKIFSTPGHPVPVSGFSTTAGKMMAYETFSAFYHIDADYSEACNDIYENGQAGANCRENFDVKDAKWNGYVNDIYDAHLSQDPSYLLENFDLAVQKSKDDKYMMDYFPYISTLCGGFISYILILFCFDVALRSVKLGFLRMIAPIPIVSRIDPKKGSEVFNKWLKECTSTYLDLFVRILAINFALFIILQIPSMDFVDASTGLPTTENALVKVFIIMGALLFAKQLPKLIENITGLKMDGKFEMNPLKKLSEVPGLGGLGSAAGGLVGSAALAGGRFLSQAPRGLANGVKNKALGGSFKDGWSDSWTKTKTMMSARMRTAAMAAKDNAKNITGDSKKYHSYSLNDKDIAKSLGTQNANLTAQRLGEQKYAEVKEKEAKAENEARRAIENEIAQKGLTGEAAQKYRKDNESKIKAAKDAAKYSIYAHKEFADSVKFVDDAKDRRNILESEAKTKKLLYEANSANMTAEEKKKYADEVTDAEVAAKKASSDYDKAVAAHKKLREMQIYSKDVKVEDAYHAADDYHSSSEKVSAFVASNKEKDDNSSNDGDSSSNTSTGESNYTTQYADKINTNEHQKPNNDFESQQNVGMSSANKDDDVQERINESVGVHDAPTKEEHAEKYDEYVRFFNSPEVAKQIDENERKADEKEAEAAKAAAEHNAKQEEYTKFFNEPSVSNQIDANEEKAAEHDVKQEEYNNFFNDSEVAKAVQHNVQQAEYNEMFSDPAVSRAIDANEAQADIDAFVNPTQVDGAYQQKTDEEVRHNARQEEYTRFFNEPSVSNQIDINETKAAEHDAKQAEYDAFFNKRKISKQVDMNERIASLRDGVFPNDKNDKE